MRRWTVALASVLAAGIALGTTIGPVGAAPGPGEAPSDPAKDRALELFAQSEPLYNEGKFSQAAELLEKAYGLYQEPLLLYNLARAREGNGEAAAAADAYQSYLEREPNAVGRGAVEQRIVSLREQQRMREELGRKQELERQQQLARADAGAPGASAEQASEEQPGVLAGPLPSITAGIGVVGLGVGVALGVTAQGRHDDAVAEPVQADAVDLQDGARQLALGANIALVAGGTLAALGAVLGIVGLVGATDEGEAADKSTARRPRVWVEVGPAAGSLRVRF